MPTCARRVVSVATMSAYGAPEETPRNSAATGAASVYGRTGLGTYSRQLAARVERGAELNARTPLPLRETRDRTRRARVAGHGARTSSAAETRADSRRDRSRRPGRAQAPPRPPRARARHS